MKHITMFALFATGTSALGGLLNWATGLGFNAGQQITWGLALFTGLILGSLAEQSWSTKP